MTSYSGNADDVTNFLLFWKVLGLCCIPTLFHCCQTPNGRVNLGGGEGGAFWVAQTPSKIGLTWPKPPSLLFQAGKLTGVQGDIRCKVFTAPFHSKIT